MRVVLFQFSMFFLLLLIHYEWKQGFNQILTWGSKVSFSARNFIFVYVCLSVRLSPSSPLSYKFLTVSCFMMRASSDVSVRRTAHTHTSIFTQPERREAWGTWGSFVVIILFSFADGRMRKRRGVWMKTKTVTPLLSVLLAGGLYGWKWGVLSATSLAPTVPAALSEDQPERRATDYHRHGGPVPHWKAARSPGLPHGEFQPMFILARAAPPL